MRALLILGLFTSVAHAEIKGGSFMHYEVSGLTVVDEQVDRPAGPVAKELYLGGARLHGFIAANNTVAYHTGLDILVGGTSRPGGFAYDIALFPAGTIVRFGATAIAGVGVGVGFSGATGALDDAVTLPVEVILEVGRKHRLLARARFSYVSGAASRQSAAPSIPFADELDATLGFRLGRAYDRFGLHSGNGYFLGVTYREVAGMRFAGLTLGYSIDLATPRDWLETTRDE
jgi:hypothetical protein